MRMRRSNKRKQVRENERGGTRTGPVLCGWTESGARRRGIPDSPWLSQLVLVDPRSTADDRARSPNTFLRTPPTMCQNK